ATVFICSAVAYCKRVCANGVDHSVVPSPGMRQCDFSDAAYLSKLNGYSVTGVPGGSMFTNGKLNSAADPNGQALINLYPLPNEDQSKLAGFNYPNGETRNRKMFNSRGRWAYN